MELKDDDSSTVLKIDPDSCDTLDVTDTSITTGCDDSSPVLSQSSQPEKGLMRRQSSDIYEKLYVEKTISDDSLKYVSF